MPTWVFFFFFFCVGKERKKASDLGIEPSRLQTRRLEGIHYGAAAPTDSDTAGENWVTS